MNGMRLFDNYEEDGQLSLFSADYDDWDEDWEEASEEDAVSEDEKQSKQEKKESVKEDINASTGKTVKEKKDPSAKTKATSRNSDGVKEQKTGSIGAAVDTYEKAVAGLEITNAGPTIRVKYCASCGKLLFVKEETAGFHSECNNCGIKYFQKL